MLVHIKQIVDKAIRGNYAVGAFNVNNLETVLAVLRAGEKFKSPVIVQITESAIKYAGLEELTALVKAASNDVKIPAALHLDHGHDFEIIKQCIEHGFSSVMIDGSALPFEKNVAITKKIVQYGHLKNVWVQGELGQLLGQEEGASVVQLFLTNPEQAKQFVEKTKVNTLAVAIGNYHGVKKIIKKLPKKLDFKRLAAIAKLVNIPLVLHGASGFPSAQIKKAIKMGIRIVNIDSELRVSFTKAERVFLNKNKNVFDPRKILEPAIVAMQRTVEEKIKIFGSAGKGN